MKKFFSEFKEFALKGNMIDLAIGIIIGSAFNAIVNSIVNDILMPFFGIIIGGKDFTNLNLTVGDAVIAYGNLIQNIINFLIIAFSLFVTVKALNKLKRQAPKEAPAPPKKPDDVELLEEIRDALIQIKEK